MNQVVSISTKKTSSGHWTVNVMLDHVGIGQFSTNDAQLVDDINTLNTDGAEEELMVCSTFAELERKCIELVEAARRKFEVKTYPANYQLLIDGSIAYEGSTEFDPDYFTGTDDVVECEIDSLIEKGVIREEERSDTWLRIGLGLAFANDIPDDKWGAEI